MTYSPLDPAPKGPISVHVSSLLVVFLSIVVIEAPKIAWSKPANSSTDRCSTQPLTTSSIAIYQTKQYNQKRTTQVSTISFHTDRALPKSELPPKTLPQSRFRISRSSSQHNSTPYSRPFAQKLPHTLLLAAAMDRQPHREINRNAVFGLVLAMWALGIIYQFLGLLPEVVNLVVPFVPLGFSLHSFNHSLFPGQEAPVSTPFCQWIPILSLIVFINNAIALPSRNKLHVLVCVVTMILGCAQIILENIQAHLPLWFAQAMHFFIVTVHFKIWYYTFIIVRRGEGR